MAAYKFYSQYAMKTNDNTKYLESFEDRVAFNALYFANGDEELAWNLADELINQRYQPATPSFLNAGRARRGEFISCFLLDVTDDMNSICQPSQLPHGAYAFDQFKTEDFREAFHLAIEEKRREVEAIIASPEAPHLRQHHPALERSGALLEWVSGSFYNLPTR